MNNQPPPPIHPDLQGKTALLTGSSRGLGAVLARGMAEAGMRVILNGREAGSLAQSAAALRKAGLVVETAPFDVTNEAAIMRAAAEIEQTYGGLDVLVNNAGINRRAPLEEIETTDWDAVLESNLKGPWLVAKHFVRPMLRRGSGAIVNIASLMSFAGRAHTGAYTASKGGVALLTKAMAVEWGGRGIRCNAIAPGYFLSEMTRPLAEDESFDAWVRSRTPSERWGDPSELVGPLLFLASSGASYVNGQILYVDGGWTAKL